MVEKIASQNESLRNTSQMMQGQNELVAIVTDPFCWQRRRSLNSTADFTTTDDFRGDMGVEGCTIFYDLQGHLADEKKVFLRIRPLTSHDFTFTMLI